MFTWNNMQALLSVRPFVPFRLWLSDGGHINVRSPEQVLPLRQYALVGLLDPNAIDEPFDRHMLVWYMHVTRCEALVPGASPLATSGEPPSGSPSPATGS
jgi:hypothetical protein